MYNLITAHKPNAYAMSKRLPQYYIWTAPLLYFLCFCCVFLLYFYTALPYWLNSCFICKNCFFIKKMHHFFLLFFNPCSVPPSSLSKNAAITHQFLTCFQKLSAELIPNSKREATIVICYIRNKEFRTIFSDKI